MEPETGIGSITVICTDENSDTIADEITTGLPMGEHLVEPLKIDGYELDEGQDVELIVLTEEEPHNVVEYFYTKVE